VVVSIAGAVVHEATEKFHRVTSFSMAREYFRSNLCLKDEWLSHNSTTLDARHRKLRRSLSIRLESKWAWPSAHGHEESKCGLRRGQACGGLCHCLQPHHYIHTTTYKLGYVLLIKHNLPSF
jgi:hypothetical protein